MEVLLIATLTVVSGLQLAAGWLFLRQHRAMQRLNDRISHMLAGVSLLADTTEGGFRDVAQEIERLGSVRAAHPRQRAATQRRITTAARRGQSVQEIAAAEQVSEGEVNLRLQLADSAPRRQKTAEAAAV